MEASAGLLCKTRSRHTTASSAPACCTTLAAETPDLSCACVHALLQDRAHFCFHIGRHQSACRMSLLQQVATNGVPLAAIHVKDRQQLLRGGRCCSCCWTIVLCAVRNTSNWAAARSYVPCSCSYRTPQTGCVESSTPSEPGSHAGIQQDILQVAVLSVLHCGKQHKSWCSQLCQRYP